MSLFGTRATVALVAVTTLSFVGALVLRAFEPDEGVPGVPGPGAWSRSALGHRGLAELLRARDVPVVVSRRDPAARVAERGVVVAAEPEGDEGHARTAALVMHGRPTVVVLPKWTGVASEEHPAWMDRVALRPIDDAARVLKEIGVEGTVERPAAGPEAADGQATLTHPQVLTIEGMEPLVTAPEGVVAARVPDREAPLVIVADPDLLNNHGLGRGGNARLALDLLDRLRRGGAVVFDVTIHPRQAMPPAGRALFKFPLVLVTIQLVLAVGVLLWASMRRFGAPLPPRPALEPGPRFLVENTAELLRYGGHSAAVLARYLRGAVRDVGAALRPPAGLRGPALTEWLDRLAEGRGLAARLAELERELPGHGEAELVRRARAIHQWRAEMIHGSTGGAGPGRPAAP
jgi:hypothetical protein